MLRTTTTRSAENLPSDMAEDAEVGGNGDGGDDETVKRSPLSKKPNVPTSSQLKAPYGRLQKKALVRSAGPVSVLDTTPHQLSSCYFRAPVLFLSGTSSLSLTFRQNCPLQSAYLLTATSMLGLVPNQGFNHARGRLAYQTSFYFSKPICLSIRSLSA